MFNGQTIITMKSQATFLTIFGKNQQPLSKCVENSPMALFVLSFSIYNDATIFLLCSPNYSSSFWRYFRTTSIEMRRIANRSERMKATKEEKIIIFDYVHFSISVEINEQNHCFCWFSSFLLWLSVIYSSNGI